MASYMYLVAMDVCGVRYNGVYRHSWIPFFYHTVPSLLTLNTIPTLHILYIYCTTHFVNSEEMI